MRNSPPLGVRLISLFYLFIGSIMLIFHLMLGQHIAEETSGSTFIWSFVGVIFLITVGIGLWLLRNWARYLLLAGLVLGMGIETFFMNKPTSISSLILNIGILCYLFLWPNVRNAFK